MELDMTVKKAKCVSHSCGYEMLLTATENVFYDTLDEGDIVFEIERKTGYTRGYLLCPLCRHQCAEID
mgnify:CR=1 FL=1